MTSDNEDRTSDTDPRSSLFYPDNGELYEDRAVLRNAVKFTTAQRAYVYSRNLKELDTLGEEELSYLAVESFRQYVETTEDLLGWLFALTDGTALLTFRSGRCRDGWKA